MEQKPGKTTQETASGTKPGAVNSLSMRLRKKPNAAFVTPAKGFIPVFLILVLFLISAVFVKPLFFGFLAAVLSLRYEQFLERCFFDTAAARAVTRFFRRIGAPLMTFRQRITRRLGDVMPEGEAEEKLGEQEGEPCQDRRRMAARSSATAVLSVLILTLLLSWGLVHFLRPFAMMSSETISKWAQGNHVIEKLEQKTEALLNRMDPPSEEEAGMTVRARLRERIVSALEANNVDVAKFTLMAGNQLLKNVFHVTAWIGEFAFDLIMFLFFYYFFLLKMAQFSVDRKDSQQNLGEWTVNSIYQTGWLPAESESERGGAALVFNHIYEMFQAWLVGYFWIIVLETILYSLIFVPFGVPFWPILALIAGSTILLPFLGPVLAALLSIAVTILFAHDGIVMPIIGVALAYLLIHVILEQLFLYPILVGEAIGLTLVETIIVVLLGAVAAGVSGMILAVPAAALVKLLMPLFYSMLGKRRHAAAGPEADPPAGGGAS